MKLHHIAREMPNMRRLARIRTVVGRRRLMRKFPTKSIRAISSCCSNALKGNLPLNKSQKKKLQKHKRHIKALVNPKTKMASKRRLLIQNGGFLGALIPAIAAILPAIISAFSKK